jgi:hypothetical protein
VSEFLQRGRVGAGDAEAGDDQDEVVQAAVVECAKDLEQVGFDAGQERVGGLVEQLDRCDRGAEGPVADQHLDRLLGGAQQVGCFVLEVAPEVAHAIAAVEGAADDVVQRQPGLSVSDDLRHVRVQRCRLVGGH